MLFNREPNYTHWQTKPLFDTNLGISAAMRLLIFFLQARTPPAGTESSVYSLSVIKSCEYSDDNCPALVNAKNVENSGIVYRKMGYMRIVYLCVLCLFVCVCVCVCMKHRETVTDR